ncbi:PA14 domain-containing protein [Chitinophaga niabensis]|uniref:PA14 domain-containing protein n=1 Tax=Chitinophaga niabensis TaxID=536979 RepID=A0A1N6DEM7_9BACT|nr:PA14 domain-containing protein [Chitinophaga niabensis]SIN69167.1 PA14 domain-containing protein [Chitinophaga niabensis]
MILAFAEKWKKTFACLMLGLIYFEIVVPPQVFAHGRGGGRYAIRNRVPVFVAPVYTPAPVAAKKVVVAPKVTMPAKAARAPFNGGPTQPESQDFHSINGDDMVNLFTGDFTYKVPLLDVGGYPLAIGYNGGPDMAQEASWVGLGWNINPGSITRNMRGLPDDFNGRDSVTKTTSVKENKTIGASGGVDVELIGLPITIGASAGLFHNTYRGWGIESGVNASLNVGEKASGPLSGGLSLNNNSQEGFTVSPNLSLKLFSASSKDKGSVDGSVSMGLSYNSRSGLKALQFSSGVKMYRSTKNRQIKESIDASQEQREMRALPGQIGSSAYRTSNISFNTPAFTPSMDLPYTSRNFTATVKLGLEYMTVHPSISITGYVSKQYIAKEDQVRHFPAYGYLNFGSGKANPAGLLDYNREKEIPYREKPDFPNIAIPSYTYDVFSISGEGTGGMFRAYRSDIGYVHDHSMRTKDQSQSASLDLGFGNLFHVGANFAETRAFTQTGPWQQNNSLSNTVAFTESDKDYEAVYFRNPGEMAINSGAYYKTIGGADLVVPKIVQSGRNSPNMQATNFLSRYKGEVKQDEIQLTAANAVKKERDKRSQVITHLTAEEADITGFPRFIENYSMNKFSAQQCEEEIPDDIDQDTTGFRAEYFFRNKDLKGQVYHAIDTAVNYPNLATYNYATQARWNFMTNGSTNFSIRWRGRIKAPVTGVYTITLNSDDGVRLFVNDSAIVDDWTVHALRTTTRTLNLEEGKIYNVRLEYFQNTGDVVITMKWQCGNVIVQAKDMFIPSAKDEFVAIEDQLVKEKRVNTFRKSNHISQLDVLNSDGRRYIYGLPVYNLKQKEVTFAIPKEKGNALEGLTSYNHGSDNTTDNMNGQDRYFSSEEIPAYAHTFLLTGVVTPDYVDITGNGISDDDPGDAIKFNYTKIAGAKNPYTWRTPFSNKANYSEGMKSDNRDDKGSYIYGEKELWYLNTIESKNMIATFTLEDRMDLAPISESGVIDTSKHIAKRLKEINLYTKADFLKYNTKARPVKTVHFEYSYELCPGAALPGSNIGKLTLKKIWFSYNGNKKGIKNAYQFNYNAKNPGYDQKSFDRWGTYKDPAQNPGSNGQNLVTNAEFPYAIQDSAVAASNAAAWTLDSIQLPSGGRMKITYESDDYAFVQNRRAAQMSQVAGFSFAEPAQLNQLSNQLTGSNGDNLYVAIHVSEKVNSKSEVYYKYLEGINKLYFRLNVKMPDDKWGNGHEFVSGYANLDKSQFGYFNNGNTIWVKLVPMNKAAEDWQGNYSPMAKTAISFLRLNLPSKAFPGSDIGDNLDFQDGIQLLFSMGDNIVNAFRSFDETARSNKWAREVDLSRSSVRLHSPGLKKYGGGLRVKRITIYDHWNAMTKQKESIYGTEYSYTTTRMINGKPKVISSGVAEYEPMLGGEENSMKEPLEYVQQMGPLAPVSLGYVEVPLGETFFPGASVGYSKVRKRSINTTKTRSATGYDETAFYTAYDFPIITEYSKFSPETKLRHKPNLLMKLLAVDAKHHLVLSQGFKIELNDMHGKLRYTASYAETDKEKPISYSEHFYHVDNPNAVHKHLKNNVLSMNAKGEIDTTALIGMDIELMMDMREQITISNGVDINVNVDAFTTVLPPIISIPSFAVFPQRQENKFRSIAAVKVVNRHGIVDSIVTVEKGSKVLMRNMLYDGETGDVLLTATQNEFNDTIYQFNYPSGWMYDGMSGAYKNINTLLKGVNIREGRIITSLGTATPATYFSSGDEILIYSRNKVSGVNCTPALATWRSSKKIWAVDANALSGAAPEIFFMDQDGAPFTGDDVIMKVVRSGRKNISASVGSVTMMGNPLVMNAGKLELKIDQTSRIINASVIEYKQNWQVEDRRKEKITCDF